ncbi:palmitoyltransferase swf1 [Anaeramoeba flamelloides]|uniref:Palmitoyltransferase n=1 Tax=Anaeramoeba flamelloides TaxID=1746091 RepID=A0AAV8AAW8_9EUKA|nr:palmitoyltransferase swf1 [Anaeramoeba flamelloides]
MRILTTKICGTKIGVFSTFFQKYFLYSRNPIILLFYLLITGVGIFFFFKDVFPFFFETESLGKKHLILIPLCLVFVVFSLLISVLSDPGTITQENYKMYIQKYPYDNQIFFPRICETCGFQKPARSKHCKILNKCISKYDHYCGWLINAVGEKNYRWFLLFLISNCILCFYGFYFILKIVYSQLVHSQIFMETVLKLETGFQKDLLIVLLKIILNNQSKSIALLFLTLIMGISLLVFILYHFYLISKNVTTNEKFKLSDLKNYIIQKKKQLKYYKLLKKQQIEYQKQIQILNRLKKLKNMEITEQIKKLNIQKPEITQTDIILLKLDPNNLENIYNQGFWKNFYQVFFPNSPHLHPPSKQPTQNKTTNNLNNNNKKDN